jgi:hypothetical protein
MKIRLMPGPGVVRADLETRISLKGGQIKEAICNIIISHYFTFN